MKAWLIGCLLGLVLMSSPGASAADAAMSGDAATESALAWLSVVDDGDYARSWDTASSFFQQGVSKERWITMVRSVRDQLGALKSRSESGVNLTKSLPGVPDGDYAVVRFQSSFANKADAIESVTMILEQGRWMAAGYFIR
jgi:hypothetical protein